MITFQTMRPDYRDYRDHRDYRDNKDYRDNRDYKDFKTDYKQQHPYPNKSMVPAFADPVKEWKMYVKHYGILTSIGLLSLIVAAILPCIGLLFCCCRCAGHCGARSEPFDKKHDHCRKVMLNTLLIIITTAML